jgi:BlaI family transcriptional regulator, penicillinase repressor
MEILRLLWENDGQTVREICRGLRKIGDNSGPAYSSVQTRLLLMENKGLARRDDSVRPAKFFTTVTESSAQKHVFRELLNRFFRGSAFDLVLHALRTERLSPQERAAIGEKLKNLKKRS